MSLKVLLEMAFESRGADQTKQITDMTRVSCNLNLNFTHSAYRIHYTRSSLIIGAMLFSRSERHPTASSVERAIAKHQL